MDLRVLYAVRSENEDWAFEILFVAIPEIGELGFVKVSVVEALPPGDKTVVPDEAKVPIKPVATVPVRVPLDFVFVPSLWLTAADIIGCGGCD